VKVKDFDVCSRPTELLLLDRLQITSYSWSVVTTSLSCTISEILPLLQCMWRPVTHLSAGSLPQRSLFFGYITLHWTLFSVKFFLTACCVVLANIYRTTGSTYLESLELRRLKADLILTYKIIFTFVDLHAEKFFKLHLDNTTCSMNSRLFLNTLSSIYVSTLLLRECHRYGTNCHQK